MSFWNTVLGIGEEVSKLISKSGIPIASQVAGVFSHASDRVKDMNLDMKMSGLSTDIGNLKDGLANVKTELEAQGKSLKGAIDGVKSELEGQLKQQGEHFDRQIAEQDAKIATLQGEQKRQAEATKKTLKKQKQELESKIQEITENLTKAQNQLKKELENFKQEVSERFEQQERKILDNKRKIEEEKQQREEEIREVNSKIKLTNTNLENLRQEKSQLEDEFLNYRSTIDRKVAEAEQLLEDNQAEYQRKATILEAKITNNEEHLEEFQENLTTFKREQAQQKLLQQELVEELTEQSDILHFQKHKLELVANQMEEISEEIHERISKVQQNHDKLFTLATETNQKVNHLTEEVSNLKDKTAELETQIQENKQNLAAVKQEAQLTNERLNNLLKTQSLLNFDEESQNLDKIEKSIQLKAEETKLLATLKLLQQTRQLLPLKLSETEWKVGIKEGTERELPRMEGMPLDPNCRWAKEYSPEKLGEWGWDVRLHNENNEEAPLTTEDKRKEKQANSNQQTEKAKENNQSETLLEKLEQLKTETLSRLQEIQGQVSKNLKQVEKTPQKSTFQTQLTTTKRNLNRLKFQLTQKQENIKIAQQKLNQQIPWQSWETETGIKNWIEQNQTEITQINQELAQQEKELTSLQSSQEFQQELEEQEKSISQDKQEQIINEWESIQQISQQVLQDQEEQEIKEEQLDKKLEELVQQLNKQKQALAASQKSMTKWMLFLIIFLLEYVVYKKNGILGLIFLNVVLAILYYQKDTILSYRHLWEKYFLIIGYVIGNTLAYSAPEQEKYKWPSVIGFNLTILGIYGYNLYQQNAIKLQINQTSQEIQQSDQQIITQQNEKEASKINQQVELLRKAVEIEENLTQAKNNLANSDMTWQKIKTKYPDFAKQSILLKELKKADEILNKEKKEESEEFLTKLSKIPTAPEEELQLLTQLHLTTQQFITLSSQSQYLTKEEKITLKDNYFSLTNETKLTLLNSGLNNLGIDNLEKKEIFVKLNQQLCQERSNFGLSTQEKENILRLLITTLELTPQQRESLEKMGVSFFDASNWQISEEQKNQLLTFGLQRIKLTNEQKTNLITYPPERFKKFLLNKDQEEILQSLASLIREEKYSLASLELLKSLQLNSSALSFLTNEEILPIPHTDFGEVKNPYLPLKFKYLSGENKVLTIEEKQRLKQLRTEEIQAQKLSILTSLLEFAKTQNELNNLSHSLNKWVKVKVLKGWQRDILLTLELKTIPQYNFFELLKIAGEINNQSFTKILEENFLVKEYEKYLELQKIKPITINKTIWEKFIAFQNPQQKNIFKNVNLEKLIDSKIQEALSSYSSEAEIFHDSKEILEEISEPIPQTSPNSRYDDLLNTLNSEELARSKKKQEREAAKNKLEEIERLRREEKLSEKDKKLQENELKRQQEKELAEQEEVKRKEAEEQRTKILQEEQEEFLQRKLANIESRKKAAELALENQRKENELNEQKKRDEIARLEQENQQEQERLKKQAELIEEEKQKKLDAIALEDKEQRQLIERKANEEKARIQQELDEKKRKNEAELKQKENELLRKKEEEQIELDRLQKEINLQQTLGEELKQAGNRREAMLKGQKNQQQALRELREQMYNSCLNFYLNTEEIQKGTRYQGSPVPRSGCHHLKDLIRDFPTMTFNLHFGDIYGGNWDGWGMAMKTFYKCVGSKFVNTSELKQIIEREVHTLNYLDSK